MYAILRLTHTYDLPTQLLSYYLDHYMAICIHIAISDTFFIVSNGNISCFMATYVLSRISTNGVLVKYANNCTFDQCTIRVFTVG